MRALPRQTTLSSSALEAAGLPAERDVQAYEPVGCSRCNNSGYKGRRGVYEVMKVSEEIRVLTVERASADAIRAVAVREGMRQLRDDASTGCARASPGRPPNAVECSGTPSS